MIGSLWGHINLKNEDGNLEIQGGFELDLWVKDRSSKTFIFFSFFLLFFIKNSVYIKIDKECYEIMIGV